MNSSRTSRRLALAAIIAALVPLAALLTGGCYDDLHPNRAEVKVRFAGDPASMARGAQLLVDGAVVIDSVSAPEWNSILDQGTHTFIVRKDCATVEPAESLTVDIKGGEPRTFEFLISLRCGLLAVNFNSSVPGIEAGTKIWLDDRLVVDSLASPSAEFVVEPGDHSLRFEPPECTEMDRTEVQTHVDPKETKVVDVAVQSMAGIIQVESTPPGFPVRVDGVPRGVTPVNVTCNADGSHEVIVSPPPSIGYEILGDTLQNVVVSGGGTSSASFQFDYEALPQFRGVMLELFTSNYCSNCPASDHAVADLDRDPSLDAEAFAGVELHLRWGGFDPLYNDNVNEARMVFYNADQNTAPVAYFNGMDQYGGSGSGILEIYRAKVMNTYGQTGEAAIYWSNVAVEGDILRGDVRCVAIGDLARFESPTLYAFYAKDSLMLPPEQDRFNVGYYMGVAREFMSPVDLKAAGAAAEDSHIDVPVSFDLSGDPGYPTPEMKVVAFVQDAATKEVIQVREKRVRIP